MTSVRKLEGRYLDSRFRRVEIYVCGRRPEPHKFDIPVEGNQRTEQEDKWLRDLEDDRCPLCEGT